MMWGCDCGALELAVLSECWSGMCLKGGKVFGGFHDVLPSFAVELDVTVFWCEKWV